MLKTKQNMPLFKPKKKPFSHRLGRGLFVTFVIVGMGLAFGGYQLKKFGQQEIELTQPVIIDFPRGTGIVGLSGLLESKGIIDNAMLFNLWVRYNSNYAKYQAGTYRFEGKVSPVTIAETISKGKIYEPVLLQYTIPEGFTLKQFRDRLVAHKVGTAAEIDSLVVDKDFIQSLQVPSISLEGYIYPATYSFNRKITAREAIKRAVDTFWEKLPENYAKDVAKMGLDLNQAVIMASLIETETLHDDERPMVSEVIWRRFKKGEPLGIDSAIIYGIADYKGDIRWKHLKDTKNPYNTRIRKGFPPTAVGSPSLASLKAVLNPTDTGYYYYVLDVANGTRHHFSKTLTEHNHYVRKLVQATKVNPGKDNR